MKVNIGGKGKSSITLENPVMTASGTFGYGLEFTKYFKLDKIGGLVTKGLSPQPREGNPYPRIVETPSGMLNSIGLQNVGVDVFINDKLPKLRKHCKTSKVIANIFAEDLKGYGEVARKLDGLDGVAGVEINISCPNVKKGGIVFGTDPREARKVVEEVRRNTSMHVMTKLSPNVTDIKVMVEAVQDGGTDSISLINTFTGMAIDVETGKPILGTVRGGLSGPAIRPLAVFMTWEASKVAKVPLIGIGGISNYKDALEFILAGASAIQVGTMNFVDPKGPAVIVDDIKKFMKQKKITDFKDLIGSMKQE